MKVRNHNIHPALLIVDMQNGFVTKGGSYDLMGINVSRYAEVVPTLKRLIDFCRKVKIPIFYSQAVREESGIDLLTRSHRILPKSREERIKRRPICIRGSWDAEIINELKPNTDDHVVIKRRDSVFQDTEFEVWLQSLGIDAIIFSGIDTSICVESSLRDAFNHGYDIIMISDATASNNLGHYNSTLDNIRNYYGLVMSFEELASYFENEIK